MLPAGYSYVSSTPSAGSYAAGTGVWTIGALANGASATLTMHGDGAQAGGTTNSASVSAATTQDPDPEQQQRQRGHDARGAGRPAVAQDRQQRHAERRQQRDVHDHGDEQRPEQRRQRAGQRTSLPAGYTFVSATPSIGSYNAGTGVWSGIGTLASGGSATLDDHGDRARVGGPYLNTATGSARRRRIPNPEQQQARRRRVAGRGGKPCRHQNRQQRDLHAGRYGHLRDRRHQWRAVRGIVRDGERTRCPRASRSAVLSRARWQALRPAAASTGIAGQTRFGTTGATIAAGAGNSLTFTVPVNYASSMTTATLVNTVDVQRSGKPAGLRQRQQHTAGERRAGRRRRPTAAARTRPAALRRMS